MFGNKKDKVEPVQRVENVTIIEISDESKQALAAIHNDIEAVEAMLGELLGNARKIVSQLSGEITAQIPVSEPLGTLGIEVFAAEDEENETPKRVKKSQAMAPDDPNRIRETPFTRRPRSVQVAWLLSIMQPGEWYNAADLAREQANEPREVRYLRHAIGGRFREMLEDELVVRRECSVRGAMYEYQKK